MTGFGTGRRVAIAAGMAVGLAFAAPAAAQVQTPEQRRCFSVMAGNVTRVDTTQARENQKCVGDYAFGKLTTMTVDDCLTADRKGKMARLEARISGKQLDLCSGADEPDFGFVEAPDLVAGVLAPQADFLAAVLGPIPELVIVDRTGGGNRDEAVCQNSLLKAADHVIASTLRGFGACGKKGLRSKADPFTSSADLESCIEDARVEAKTDRAVTMLSRKLANRCTARGVDYTTVIAGDCQSEPTEAEWVECITEDALCEACLALNAGYGLGLDCDEVDNGVVDGSCTGPSPTGAFVDGPILF